MPTVFERPQNLKVALDFLSQGDWQILSGGTDFYPALGDRQPQGNVLDISGIAQMREIIKQNDFWRIGALTTWSDLIAAELPRAFDGLKLAAKEVGSVQIQNRATIVGNICNASPAADGLPPLLTLNAQVEISSIARSRLLPVEKFVTGNRQTELRPGELVTAIVIPAASTVGLSSFLKLGSRKYLVISISMVAARIEADNSGTITDAAISVGACSLVAQRLHSLEREIVGHNINENLVGLVRPDHLDELSPIDDVRSTAGYRIEATLELVRRIIIQTTDESK